jgi:hypothetical protein
MSDAVKTAQQMQSLLPTAAPAAALAPLPPEPVEDDPTKIVKVGEWALVQTKADGALRLLDTLFANGDKIMAIVEKERARMGAPSEPAAPAGSPQMSAPSIPGMPS